MIDEIMQESLNQIELFMDCRRSNQRSDEEGVYPKNDCMQMIVTKKPDPVQLKNSRSFKLTGSKNSVPVLKNSHSFKLMVR